MVDGADCISRFFSSFRRRYGLKFPRCMYRESCTKYHGESRASYYALHWTREACSTLVAFLLCVLCSTQRALGLLLQQRIYDEVVSCDSEAEISINYVPDEENPNFVWQDGSSKQSGQLTDYHYHVTSRRCASGQHCSLLRFSVI